jgi:hypothetical protein
VLEDGEIAEAAADGLSEPPAAADAVAADAAAANGKHRSSEDGSAGHKEVAERPRYAGHASCIAVHMAATAAAGCTRCGLLNLCPHHPALPAEEFVGGSQH